MVTKAVIVDSSVWVAYFYDKDSQHSRAVKLLEQVTSSIVVPEYVLLETVTILRKKREERALKDFLNIGAREDVYLPAGELGVTIARMYASKKYQKLSFVDAGLLLLSKHYQIITFDKALQQAIAAQK